MEQFGKFNFMRLKFPAAVLSIIFVLLSLGFLVVKQLNWGLDFTGGTLIHLAYEKPADLTQIRGLLHESGYEDAVVQHFGTSQDVVVRVQPRESLDNEKLGDQIIEVLKSKGDALTKKQIQFVGPQIGEELTEQGGLAMVVALICIMFYVAVRFEWRLAVGSVMALAHDVTIVLGIFSITGIEFDLTVLAAVLAVIGYSLNDTIVVFDRIRENFRLVRKGDAVDVVNLSLNQTLSRTLMTSFTTLLVLLALFFVGGETIHSFAFALIMGIVVGTYSSIYVASNIALWLGISKEDLIPTVVEKEGEDQEGFM